MKKDVNKSSIAALVFALTTLLSPPGLAASFQGLGHLADFSDSWATGISADGSVVVGQSAGEAFRWTSAGGMVGLGHLPGEELSSYANGVSADGSVVVGGNVFSWGHGEAFRWTSAGGMVGLGWLAGGPHVSSVANDVSDDGSVVVGSSYSALLPQAFRWTSAGGMVGLGDLPGGVYESSAEGISADGSVVVGRGNSDLGWEAFYWAVGGGMQSLKDILTGTGVDLTGWSLTSAVGVSADGLTVVGTGTNPLGGTEGWIATVAKLPADFDGNGTVDASDLALWQVDYGLNAKCDADGDGDTDGVDFLLWQRQFGTGAKADALFAIASTNTLGSRGVPEPTSLAMCGVYLAVAVLVVSRGAMSQQLGIEVE